MRLAVLLVTGSLGACAVGMQGSAGLSIDTSGDVAFEAHFDGTVPTQVGESETYVSVLPIQSISLGARVSPRGVLINLEAFFTWTQLHVDDRGQYRGVLGGGVGMGWLDGRARFEAGLTAGLDALPVRSARVDGPPPCSDDDGNDYGTHYTSRASGGTVRVSLRDQLLADPHEGEPSGGHWLGRLYAGATYAWTAFDECR